MEDALTQHVIRLRDSTGARSALRRGQSVATEHYAYPYLAPWWNDRPWMREPLLLFAALVASSRVQHDADVPLGRFLKAKQIGSTERRLMAVQSGNVRRLHETFRSSFKNAHGAANFETVWRYYRTWDHPNMAVRRDVRRRLLIEFYQTPADVEQASDQLLQQGAS